MVAYGHHWAPLSRSSSFILASIGFTLAHYLVCVTHLQISGLPPYWGHHQAYLLPSRWQCCQATEHQKFLERVTDSNTLGSYTVATLADSHGWSLKYDIMCGGVDIREWQSCDTCRKIAAAEHRAQLYLYRWYYPCRAPSIFCQLCLLTPACFF